MVSSQEVEILSFLLGDQSMAFDVDSVEMVIERTEIRPVPKAKFFVEGVINLRGRVIPVVNLGKVLGINVEDRELKSIIVVKTKDVEVGFLVNRVWGVMRISESQVDHLSVSDKFGKKFKGLIKRDGNLTVYLNIEEIIEEITAKEGA